MKKLTIILLTIILLGCVPEPEYQVLEIVPDIISYSNNLIKLTSQTMVYLDNSIAHSDKWWIAEGVTFELIIHEPEDYVRFYNTPDFITSLDRIYVVGEGRDHITDFNVLNPPALLYYFSIEVIINGDSTLIDYEIDSN